MHILIRNNNSLYEECPKYFQKNKYSNCEYFIIKEGLRRFYKIDKFKVYYINGKPFIDNNVFISISHDNDLVVCAFSEQNVGVDIQFFRNNYKRKVIEDFSIKESIIKLENFNLLDIFNIEIENYYYKVYHSKKYVLTYACYKNNAK